MMITSIVNVIVGVYYIEDPSHSDKNLRTPIMMIIGGAIGIISSLFLKLKYDDPRWSKYSAMFICMIITNGGVFVFGFIFYLRLVFFKYKPPHHPCKLFRAII